MLEAIYTLFGNVAAVAGALPASTWDLLGAGLGISAFQHTATLRLKAKGYELGDKTNLFVTIAICALVASLAQFNSLVAADPATFGGTTVAILGITQPLYRYAVKPAAAWFLGILADARARNAAQRFVQARAAETEAPGEAAGGAIG